MMLPMPRWLAPIAHARRAVAPTDSQSLLVSALSLLPALFGTPRRAVFTGGVLLGLAGPALARVAARWMVEVATRRRRAARRRQPGFEVLVAERVVRLRVRSDD